MLPVTSPGECLLLPWPAFVRAALFIVQGLPNLTNQLPSHAMSIDLTLPRPEPIWKALPLIRWTALVLLFAAEVVTLTIRFDAEHLARESALWSRLLVMAHHLPYIGLAIVSAVILFAGRRLVEDLRQAAATSPGFAWMCLLGHVCAFGVFYRVTAILMEGGAIQSGNAGIWLALWFTLGWLTLILWAFTLLPANAWLNILRNNALPIVSGTAIGVTAWYVSQWSETLAGVLQQTTFQIVNLLLSMLVSEVVCQPDQSLLATPNFYVYISPECSGYEGIGLIAVFLAAYLWFFRTHLRFPRALLLLPLGILIIYLLNAIRITALILVGSFISPQIALGGFHSQAGWLAFNAVAIGLILLSHRLSWFAKTEIVTQEATAGSPSAPYLAPLVALVITTMITTAFSAGFDALYPLRVVVVGLVLWSFRQAYVALRANWSWTAVALGLVVFALWMAMEPLAVDPSAGDTMSARFAEMSPVLVIGWLLFRVIGSVICVPIAEELAFRGYLIRRLQSRNFEDVSFQSFTWLSFVLSSLLFGLLHGRWIAGTLAGMIYCIVLYRRGKVSDAVLAHAVTNAAIAAYAIATQSWSLWC